jgi:hypothetical protein
MPLVTALCVDSLLKYILLLVSNILLTIKLQIVDFPVPVFPNTKTTLAFLICN